MRADQFEHFMESGALAAAAEALASDRLEAGQEVAHYRIVEEIGAGGMGVVYRAHDTKLERDVALKVLIDPGLLHREARAVAALKHPNVVAVYELGESSQHTYLAMELLEGESLAERLARGPMANKEALAIAVQLADGLAHAHARGVVHRDLKPANVMLTEHGAQIIDFGLAGPDGGDAPIGTRDYASPEQAAGEPTDERSDLYSLGVVLKELLGHRLQSITDRLVAPSPDDRYQDAAELSRDLRRASTRARLVSWRSAALAALLALATLWWMRGRDAGMPLLMNPVQLTSEVGVEEHARWSPDGRTLAYHANVSGEWDIWLVPNDGRPINRTADIDVAAQFPSWSSDGTRIAFWAEESVFVMNAHDGAPHRLAAASTGSAPQWSRDGSRILVVDGAAAVIVDSSSGAELERVPLRGSHTRRFDLVWSPDERLVAYVDANAPVDELTRLRTLRLADGASFELTDGRTHARSPTWSDRANALFYVSNRSGSSDLWRQPLENGAPSGEPQQLSVGVGMRDVALSADGARLAYSKGRRVANLWRAPVSERPALWRDAEQLTFDQALIEFADVSTSGDIVVFSSDRSGNQDLWMITLSSAEIRRLTDHPAADWSPVLSTDERTIVFYSHRSGNRDVWLLSLDSETPAQITFHDAEDYRAAFSPDGATVVFDSTRAGSWDIWTLDVGRDVEGQPRQRTFHPAIDSDGRFAPDGSRLVFGSLRSGSWQLWMLPAHEPSEPTRLTETPARNPRWSPDGQHVYFLGDGARAGNVFRLDLETFEEQRVTDLAGRRGTLGLSSLATDGEWVYFTWDEDLADIWTMDVDRRAR